MRYIIDARLQDGAPRLDIRDADTGAVRLRWGYMKPGGTATRDRGARMALQDLFRKLVLLSCADKICMVDLAKSAASGTECLDCGECVSGHTPTPVAGNVVYLRDRQAPDEEE
jgi:hypothetical protein